LVKSIENHDSFESMRVLIGIDYLNTLEGELILSFKDYLYRSKIKEFTLSH